MIILCYPLLFYSCMQEPAPLLRFSVNEKAGITRDLEFVTLQVQLERALDGSTGICIKEQNKDELILGQVLDSTFQASNKITYTCLFPFSIEANSTKHYEVYISNEGKLHNEILMIEGSSSNIKIENSHFIADLTDVKATQQNGLVSGQLAGLVLKRFNNKLLERGHINMHWAPNFQKEDLEYKNFGHIINPDTSSILQGPYKTTIFKSGYVEEYPEILVSCTYEFFAGLPYFIFSSEIQMDEDIELMLLRNDEMTMDSLFTHVMYMHQDGETGATALYNDQEFKELEQDPIHDDATWLFFYNDVLNYGFGSIRIAYDNTNIYGEPSPLYKQHTKITHSSGNGRYWNRRLVHDHNMYIPQGSRYTEKNAYLVFKVRPEDPSREIEEYHKRLMNPPPIAVLNHGN